MPLGMNLHSIVVGAVAAVNPQQTISIQVSKGATLGPDGKQTPNFMPAVSVSAQVQPLSTSDIQHVEAMNIQNIQKSIYINGHIHGLVRAKNKGGDLITLADGSIWIVNVVFESWDTGWCKVGVTMQNPASVP
jgi:hypothetical protein